MLVVNLFAGPGAGKSTLAAGVFHLLKAKNKNVELVTEFAKECCWEGNETAVACPEYVFGTQYYRQRRLLGKVDVVITDSPLILGLLYAPEAREAWKADVVDAFFRFDNMNYRVVRDPDRGFNPNGRYQTESEAKAKDDEVLALLESLRLTHFPASPVGVGPQNVVWDILEVMACQDGIRKDEQEAWRAG